MALNPQKFRHDLEVLAGVDGLRILAMPSKWQSRLLYSFHAEHASASDVHNPNYGSAAAKAGQAYRGFLRAFLPKLFDRIRVDAVIGANVRYEEDVDIGVVAKELGKPYIVLHRENMLVPEHVFNFVTDRYRKLGRFRGDLIAVHNSISARSFIESAFADEKQVVVLGCLRMDKFLCRLREPRKERSRPLITLFSFKSFLKGIFPPEGYFPVFRDSHGAIARLAEQHPAIDFVIKPKPGMLRHPRFKAELDEAFRYWGSDPRRLPPNLHVDARLNAHDLILELSVVLSLNSTTQIEAAVAGLPVVMPYFKDMRDAPAGQNIKFRENTDLFDVPDTPEELMELVLARLRDPEVPSEVMEKRWALFADLVSTLGGDAVARYTDLLRTVAKETQVERRVPATEAVSPEGFLAS